MTEFRRIPLSTGVTLNVAFAGHDAKPAAILLHGFPESHRTWRELAPRLAPGAKRALVIGLGAGVVPATYARHHGLTVDVVEIDPVMVRAAREAFGYRPAGDLFVEDGRAHLERSRRAYDVVVLDAFASEGAPFHLFTREFFERVRDRLAPGGVLGINTMGVQREDACSPASSCPARSATGRTSTAQASVVHHLTPPRGIHTSSVATAIRRSSASVPTRTTIVSGSASPSIGI